MNNYIISTILFIFSCFFLASIEFLYKKYNINSEITRKIDHITACIGISVISLLFQEDIIIIIFTMYTLLMTYLLINGRLRSINNANRKSLGVIFFPLGIMFSSIISPNHLIFITSMLILAFSDTAANLVGRRYNREHKTIQGSFTFFIVTLLIFICIQGIQFFPLMILFSIFLTVIEYYAPYGSDNLFIPVIVSTLLKGLL